MHQSIKLIFEEECVDLKIDLAFYKKICELEARFVNKKQEHIEFFGGNLTGVHTVRFTDEDRDRLFIDILQVDDRALEDKVHKLPFINKEWKVSGNIFNVTCVWIMHAFDNTHLLTEEQKHEGKLRICMYMHYRFLTSILFWFFKYPADPEIAAAVYAQLSYKYVLKQNGSWGATLKARSEEILSPTSIHALTIKKLDNDERVVYMINDVYGRIKDMMKNIMGLHERIKEQGTRISRSNALIETDGELILKDSAKNIVVYTRYIRSIIPDANSFIRQELIDVIANIMQTMPPKLLHQTLKWCSDNYGHLNTNGVEKTIDGIMEHAFEFISGNRGVLRAKGDLIGFLSKLRGTYMSSRSTDESLIKLRRDVEDIIKMATKTKNDSVIAAVRTGFLLYIILRSFCRDHYTGN